MRKTAILTDSTAYITDERAKEHSIYTIPLNVVLGVESYQEQVDLDTAQFYQEMAENKVLPTTSQPAIGDFIQLFETLAKEGYKEVVCIHLSSKISGTYQTALSAGGMVEGIHVVGFDSEISCSPQSYYVLEASKLADEGLGADEIIGKLNELRQSVSAYFMVDDLNHLHRGGRLSGAQRIVGNMLKIKPILHFVEGEIVPFEKVRTEKKALSRIYDLLKEDIDSRRVTEITVIHANRLDKAKDIASMLEDSYSDISISISFFGPVIGTHLGEGSIGISWH
ncbi:DegV family protein [Alkalicoccobacillus murimartini]|uniref:DegV family protein with EDD domain n=1 Tax=Alkalicoccobacillus murimartini TaxID=171685 RepID=A0ABT9YGP6_9BACI|nr:DegV family protein [Alkalicoccobacillus murimartini]MDQ0206773.1 DegV family protein with EDD domain [Alkalicoccobacillus murimartini]